jgi:hypothetical protein
MYNFKDKSFTFNFISIIFMMDKNKNNKYYSSIWLIALWSKMCDFSGKNLFL